MSAAERLFFINVPPTTSGMHQVLSTSSGASAANYDWATALSTSVPKGRVMITLEALSQDVYVRFKSTNSTAATTSSNGRLIKAGYPGVTFYVSPTQHKYIDHIAASAGGTLKVQVSSPIGEREDI